MVFLCIFALINKCEYALLWRIQKPMVIWQFSLLGIRAITQKKCSVICAHSDGFVTVYIKIKAWLTLTNVFCNI
ncbi:hypothetical protein XELAEV_18021319mg [Xenopus laevis]|uniref:Secreted protein n=1 Tax=Xenopus laevis TaxID=8355 RepID=A0A974D9A3_XENLA|nr:hypothetical protein XELAEV_18021319mg [Xenopus laevis]